MSDARAHRGVLALAILASLALVRPGFGQHAAHQHDHPAPERLGTVTFQSSCAEAVQPELNRAVALLHSFSFRVAIDGFEKVLKGDPACGIAAWGIALSRWGNPFAGIKGPAVLQAGTEAVQRARTTGAKTPRERDYIAAVAALYDNPASSHGTRIEAYAAAMQQLAERYPEDTEARIFSALALLQTAPASDKTYARQLKAGAVLEPLFAKQPDHPGLAHYIIHAYDVPALASKAVDAARRYASIAPSAPHALHMPSHTFTRLGYWRESISTNLASAKAAAAEGAAAEELHAMDYMTYAHLQRAEDDAAQALMRQAAMVRENLSKPAAGGTAAPVSAGAYAAAAIPARYALEREDWAAAAALPEVTDPFAPAVAIRSYARALGAARSGRPEAAAQDLDRMAAAQKTLESGGDEYWAGQVAIARQAAGAWVAWAQGRRDEALTVAAAAADAEDRTEKAAISPGPLAPARELLADMQLAAGRLEEARRSYEAVLRREPGRLRSALGAGLAAERAGDRAAAAAHYRTALTIAEGGNRPGRAALEHARSLATAPSARK
jgi:hypothetical protein